MNRTIGDILKKNNQVKPPEIEDSASIGMALSQLQKHNAHSLFVMSQNSLVGIFSDHDFAAACLSSPCEIKLTAKVNTVMNQDLFYVTPEVGLRESIALILRNKKSTLPVLTSEHLPITCLALSDLVEAVMEDKDFLILELVKYITGSNFIDTVYTKENLLKWPSVMTPVDLLKIA